MTKKAPSLVLDLSNLPTDVALLQSIVVSLANHNEKLLHHLREANRRRFGRKAESVSELQMALFEKLIQEQLARVPKVEASPALPKDRPKGHGRGIPSAAVPRRQEYYPLSEAQKTCPECKSTLKKIGTDSRNVVEYVPASLIVRVQTCEKWACTCCLDAKVITSELPDLPVAKGLAGEGLLAHVVTSKFADHLPLYRQSVILKRHGFDVSRSTLGDWVAQVADRLKPLYLAMKADVLRSKVIHSDDTTVPVLEDMQRDPTRKRKARLGRLWTWVGDLEHPHTVYSFSPDRKQEWPLDFVEGWKGYLQADAYSGYHPLYARGIKEVACWAHARRKFVEAMETDSETGQSALAFIHRLYDVEREAKEMSALERQQLRWTHAKPVLDAFKIWLDAQALRVLPKSAMGQALGYSLRQWGALNCYLEDGDLAIDNNPAERALRAIALGRKNWLFAGSNDSGERAAILYSVIESCKRHGIDPFEYLRTVIGEIASVPPRRMAELLPATWKAMRLAQMAA